MAHAFLHIPLHIIVSKMNDMQPGHRSMNLSTNIGSENLLNLKLPDGRLGRYQNSCGLTSAVYEP